MGTARAFVAGSGFWPEWSARVSGRNVVGSSSVIFVSPMQSAVVWSRPVALGGPCRWRTPVASVGGNKKATAPLGTAAPGPRLWSRALDQEARDLRPHPPYGGAASAYTCSRRLGCESRSAHGRPEIGASSTIVPKHNLWLAVRL